jgi:hypothetical protein
VSVFNGPAPEVIEAWLTSPVELQSKALTGLLAAYLGRCHGNVRRGKSWPG